jgi:hypothetical protein
MIKFYNQVPSIYPNASRDFQYLSWLIDIVLNSVKHNVDDLYDLPNSKTDPRLTELLALTLGFKVRRSYDQSQLRALVAALPGILRYKGTKIAVDMAGNALIATSGATGHFQSEVKDGELEVIFPENLVDISLFTDLLPYVLPAGMTCHIIRTNRVVSKLTTELGYQDTVLAEWLPDLDWNGDNQTSSGLANLFEVGRDISDFANYLSGDNTEAKALTECFTGGLLDNTIIPTVREPLRDITAVTAEATDEATGDNA